MFVTRNIPKWATSLPSGVENVEAAESVSICCDAESRRVMMGNLKINGYGIIALFQVQEIY